MPYYDLGAYSLAITTASPEAQKWFDRGLNWTYGFNHHEAVSCFQKVLAADPSCAMAHWGIAYASGPNYNMPWKLFDKAGRKAALEAAYDATQQAIGLCSGITPIEAALISALQARYPQRALDDDMENWDDRFAAEMRAVFGAFPDALDVRSVFVEAMLNRTPWKMWDLPSGMPAEGADTTECQQVLEAAFANDPAAMQHPGLLHLYVHLMEMSPFPERALKAGDALRTLVPDAGHLVHMPTHIDVLCGNYSDVVLWNQKAVEADLKYYEREGAFNIYTGYRQHNYHFVIYGAMFLGQFEPALAAVRGMAETTPEDMLRMPSPPMADYFESYLSMEPHLLVRFGKWHEAIALPLPDDQELFCTLTAFTHYARGVAHAALGHVAEAEVEEKLFLAAKARVPDSRVLHNNKVIHLMEIATHMLRGEIAYRQGHFDQAFAQLRQAITIEDNLPYDEPWGWMQPTRHALGALLFEQGHITEAETAYREDLGLGGQLSRATVHPDNVWSLKGLYDCLEARGEVVEIVHIRHRLQMAEARADHSIKASCACAQAALQSS
ncbi:MAG: hypothetical protein P8P89_00450 [Paracoccaceae bacterium]|nr:hypothetical protein [Paracoccaceae bacterium]